MTRYVELVHNISCLLWISVVKVCTVSLTGCVRVVCSTAEVVLQQLMCSCGTGSSHQSDCGLMKKHLQKKKKKHKTMQQIHKCIHFIWLYTLILTKCVDLFNEKTELFHLFSY